MSSINHGGFRMLARTMKISDAADRQGYGSVRRAIEFLTKKFREQPEVEAVAAATGTDPRTLTELFRRWCGLTPKAFLQAVTLDNAKKLLTDSPNILEA